MTNSKIHQHAILSHARPGPLVPPPSPTPKKLMGCVPCAGQDHDRGFGFVTCSPPRSLGGLRFVAAASRVPPPVSFAATSSTGGVEESLSTVLPWRSIDRGTGGEGHRGENGAIPLPWGRGKRQEKGDALCARTRQHVHSIRKGNKVHKPTVQ